MRRCVIHVGLPKAGSTTLQHFAAKHRARFRAAGLLVPILREGRPLGHKALALSLAAGDGSFEGELLPQIETALARTGCESLLLSYEGLQRLPPRLRAPERLVAGFARIDCRVTFAAVVRPQPLFFNSFYCHSVQWFRTGERFRAFVERNLEEERFDYRRRLGQWADCPGAGFRALPLTLPGGGSLVERFLEACELPAMGRRATAPPTRNERPGVLTLELLRRLARRGAAYRLDHRFAAARKWLRRHAAERGWQEPRFMGLDGPLVERIRERFAASNQAFARRHFGEDWDRIFAADHAAAYVSNEFDAASADPRVEAEIEALAAEALARFGRPWPQTLAGCLRQQLRHGRRALFRRLPAA